MKYMGSKRSMLQNGLGELLGREVIGAGRFVDLFSGSASVAVHVATQFEIPVLAVDLQSYSSVLAEAVIGRDQELDAASIWENWRARAVKAFSIWSPPSTSRLTQEVVRKARQWCAGQTSLCVTSAYGGHYFSPRQAVWLDSLRKTLPRTEPARTVALAALIQTASRIAASPGHTAQPFQPTRTAKPFILEAWRQSVLDKTKGFFLAISKQYAKCTGATAIKDANVVAKSLRPGDLAFIDPPYSGVHYSRFYHVLETIACGSSGPVTGNGRYPSANRRPRSKFSMKSEAPDALDKLLETIAERGARAILTFPNHECSNGLSGEMVRQIATKHFFVDESAVTSQFSTLGGTGNSELEDQVAGRAARHATKELMLVLNQKPSRNTKKPLPIRS